MAISFICFSAAWNRKIIAEEGAVRKRNKAHTAGRERIQGPAAAVAGIDPEFPGPAVNHKHNMLIF
jgi:hypothetical protein